MTEKPHKIVLDTNVFISGVLWPESVPADAYRGAVIHAELLISEAFVCELSQVMQRPKFDRFLRPTARRELLDAFFRSRNTCRDHNNHPRMPRF